MRKIGLVQMTLWLALLLALAGSLKHVAWAFSTLEEGDLVSGYIQAVAVDIGLFALAYAVQQRRRERRPTRTLWIGVGAFSAISIYANLLHGLVYSQPTGAGLWELARPFVLSGALPLLVLYLSEIVSQDVQYAVQEQDKSRKRAERAEQQKLSTPEAEAGYPYPIGQAQESRAEQQRLSREEAQDRLMDILTEQPDIQITELARTLDRSRQTVYSYLTELETAGSVRKNGSGYIVDRRQR